MGLIYKPPSRGEHSSLELMEDLPCSLRGSMHRVMYGLQATNATDVVLHNTNNLVVLGSRSELGQGSVL